ncbi:probable protein arginine N-methyltransferase 1 [Drosophila subobscura]|uniref:probable protein arginine N-methyltransferase 1 n=1 Tax=Drosophila subobscura TaxID=7241 RepID=UPI00155AA280|nr:probable protein arginine N-methyltransferase 1 [Drosophila subobscura]
MEHYDRESALRARRNQFIREKMFGEAMMEDSVIFRDANVLNIFCGDGGIAMLAIKAGARHVVAIDTLMNANAARRIVRRSGMSHRITVFGVDVRNMQWSGFQFDILLCAWMDDMGVFQGKLADLIVARDRFLRIGGIIYPYMLRVSIGGMEDSEYWEATRKLTRATTTTRHLQQIEMKRPVLGHLKLDHVVTSFREILLYDLTNITLADLNRDKSFTLMAGRDAPIHSLFTIFQSVVMRPTGPVCLTHSHFTPNHRHTIFYLDVQVNACEGSIIIGKITQRYNERTPLQKLQFTIEYQGRNGSYSGGGIYHVR